MNVIFQKTHQRAFGTYPLTGDTAQRVIETALEIGYRAIDTAQMYGNEAETGASLAASGIPRESLCVTTKVHPDNYSEAAFLPSVEQSLRDLQLDAVDVLLLHWPPADGDVAPSLRLLQHAHDRGLARNIGVSNYTVQMLRDAQAVLDAPIAINQVEFHPLLNQERLMAGASALGVPLSAYCSVARGAVFKYPLFAEIGAAYGKSAGQVVLRWILQKGVAATTMSQNPDNIRANFDIMDFDLSAPDIAKIDALTHSNHRIVTKDRAKWAPEWD